MSTDSLLASDPETTDERSQILAKWKDKPVEDLLNAKVESDLYINTMTKRFDDLKNDYLALRTETNAKESLSDLIDRMKNSNKDDETPINTNREEVQPSLKPEDIEKMIAEKMTQREESNKQSANFNTIRAKLKEQFGDNATAELKRRMDTLGLDQSFTDDLARRHPTVFMKTFGLDEPQDSGYDTPPRTQQRTSFAPNTPKRDWNYYQELKKTDPYLYLNPKIAIQMHEDAQKLGKDFGMPLDD